MNIWNKQVSHSSKNTGCFSSKWLHQIKKKHSKAEAQLPDRTHILNEDVGQACHGNSNLGQIGNSHLDFTASI